MQNPSTNQHKFCTIDYVELIRYWAVPAIISTDLAVAAVHIGEIYAWPLFLPFFPVSRVCAHLERQIAKICMMAWTTRYYPITFSESRWSELLLETSILKNLSVQGRIRRRSYLYDISTSRLRTTRKTYVAVRCHYIKLTKRVIFAKNKNHGTGRCF